MSEYDKKVNTLRRAIDLLDGIALPARASAALANCRGTLAAVTNPPKGTNNKPTSVELGRAALMAAECYLWTFGHWPKDSELN